MNNVTVQSLRDQGYKVRVTHYRRYQDLDSVYDYINNVKIRGSFNGHLKLKTLELAKFESLGVEYALPRGGRTVVEVTNSKGRTLSATSYCSDNEQFNKSLGVKIALGRLAKFL